HASRWEASDDASARATSVARLRHLDRTRDSACELGVEPKPCGNTPFLAVPAEATSKCGLPILDSASDDAISIIERWLQTGVNLPLCRSRPLRRSELLSFLLFTVTGMLGFFLDAVVANDQQQEQTSKIIERSAAQTHL